MFFVFEDLWWKFFRALEAWIRWTSPIYGFLEFLETFELDPNDLWDLRRWFGWFHFKCSSYSKLNFLKFLKASGLSSSRASELKMSSRSFLRCLGLLVSTKCLRKASIYRSLGVEWATCGGVWLVTHVTAWLFRFVITYMRWVVYVIAYMCWTAYVITYTRWCVIGFCTTLGKFLLVSE